MKIEESASRRLHGAFACIIVVPLMTACVSAGVEVTALPERIDYVCANNRTLSVDRSKGPRFAGVLVDGREVVLPRSESAAQEKYSDGHYALYLDGERAMLESQGRVIYGPCTSPAPLPTYYR